MELAPGDPCPASLGPLLAAIDAYTATPLPGAAELTAELIELRRGLDCLELRFSRLSAALAEGGHWYEEGFASPIEWLRNACHMASGAAGDRICVGEQVGQLEATEAAVAGGEVGFAHLALMARTAEAAQDSGRAIDEERLLDRARQLNVTRFRDVCFHERHAADPAGYAEDQAREVEERFLEIAPLQDGGVWIRGNLDREGGAILRTALDPLARPNGHGDHRNRARRLADAMVELASHALDTGELPVSGGQRPHLQVTASFETMKAEVGSPAAEMELSIPISAASVARIACDCSLTRVLLGADSVVIDVGRTQRLVGGSRRRALHARDRHCRFPGCDRTAAWTSAHHLVHWADGGATDLDNLVLLCHRHHWMVHEGGWQLVKRDDGQLLAVPPTARFNDWIRGPDPRAA